MVVCGHRHTVNFGNGEDEDNVTLECNKEPHEKGKHAYEWSRKHKDEGVKSIRLVKPKRQYYPLDDFGKKMYEEAMRDYQKKMQDN